MVYFCAKMNKFYSIYLGEGPRPLPPSNRPQYSDTMLKKRNNEIQTNCYINNDRVYHKTTPTPFCSFFFFFFFCLLKFEVGGLDLPLEKNSGSTSAKAPNCISTMTLDIYLVAKIYPQSLTVKYPLPTPSLPPPPENIDLRILNLYLSKCVKANSSPNPIYCLYNFSC